MTAGCASVILRSGSRRRRLKRTKNLGGSILPNGFFYMMANRSRTLYSGVTSDLVRRVCEHKTMRSDGFTRRYLIDRLVYFEEAPDIRDAIAREKQVKGWARAKKVALIESMNPDWEDLSVKLGLVTAEILRSFRSLAATSTPQDDNRELTCETA